MFLLAKEEWEGFTIKRWSREEIMKTTFWSALLIVMLYANGAKACVFLNTDHCARPAVTETQATAQLEGSPAGSSLIMSRDDAGWGVTKMKRKALLGWQRKGRRIVVGAGAGVFGKKAGLGAGAVVRW